MRIQKLNLTSWVIILIIASLIVPILANAKIVPPTGNTQLTPEHVADKIVTHGYTLIDAYINELPEYTCTFPGGQFAFTLDNDARISILPACAYGKIWRNITFRNPDDSMQIIFLDGPVTGEPGIPNEEAIANAKEILAIQLSDSNMIVKEVFKEELRLNLGSLDGIQVFIDLMFDSIELSAPLASGPKPAEATLPEGVLVKVNPTNEKPVKINEISTSFKGVKTRADFEGVKKEIQISVDKVKRETKIEIDNVVVTVKQAVEIKESKLYLETSVGPKEIKVLPNAASEKAIETGIKNVEEIELKEEAAKPIYSVQGTKKARLLFIFPVTLKIETKIDAESGEVVFVKEPWWSFLAW